jgi:hypothetical protein
VYAHSKVQKEEPAMFKHSTAFVGLDPGDKRSNVFILDQDGEPIEETRIPTTEPAFRRKFASPPPCRVAMEAGTPSRWASRLLTECHLSREKDGAYNQGEHVCQEEPCQVRLHGRQPRLVRDDLPPRNWSIS